MSEKTSAEQGKWTIVLTTGVYLRRIPEELWKIEHTEDPKKAYRFTLYSEAMAMARAIQQQYHKHYPCAAVLDEEVAGSGSGNLHVPDPIHEPAHYQARDLYAELDRVLAMARAHAAEGKGKERHALPGQPFEEQGIVADSVALGSNHGNLLQIIKKGKESARLPKDQAIAELLGVINNAAAAVLVLERLDEQKEKDR